MTDDRIETALVDALLSVAPEVDISSLEPTHDLREQCDLDSMDFLNFVLALHHSLGVDIPEADYPKLATMDKARAYLDAARGQK